MSPATAKMAGTARLARVDHHVTAHKHPPGADGGPAASGGPLLAGAPIGPGLAHRPARHRRVRPVRHLRRGPARRADRLVRRGRDRRGEQQAQNRQADGPPAHPRHPRDVWVRKLPRKDLKPNVKTSPVLTGVLPLQVVFYVSVCPHVGSVLARESRPVVRACQARPRRTTSRHRTADVDRYTIGVTIRPVWNDPSDAVNQRDSCS